MFRQKTIHKRIDTECFDKRLSTNVLTRNVSHSHLQKHSVSIRNKTVVISIKKQLKFYKKRVLIK